MQEEEVLKPHLRQQYVPLNGSVTQVPVVTQKLWWMTWKVAVCLEVATGQLPSYRGSKQQQEYQNTVHYHAHKDGEAHPSSPHNLTSLYTAEQVAHTLLARLSRH